MANERLGNAFQKSAGDLLWNLFFTVTVLFLNGYRYGGGDMEEHLPQVFKKLNPALYPYDYFVVPATAHFTIRTVYVNTISFFAQLLPVATVCFAFYVLCTFCVVVYTRKITAFFFKDPYSSFLSPILVLIFLHRWTVGYNQLLDYELTCSVFASAFCVPAAYYFLKEKYALAGMLLGFASLYQLLEGLQLCGILILLILLIPQKKRWRHISAMSVAYIAAGSFTLVPIFYRQFFMPHVTTDMKRFYEIFVDTQGHYRASAFPLSDYLRCAGLLVFASALLIINKSSNLRFFVTLSSIILAGCAVYFCATELFNWNAIYKLQWFKTTIWLNFFSILMIAGYTGQLLSRYIKMNLYQPVLMILFFCVLVWQCLFVYSVPGIIRKSWAGKYMIGPYYPRTDLTLMHEWIEKNIPTDAILLSMPFDVSILCQSKRSTVIGSRAIIHEPDFYLDWYDRFARIYALDTCNERTPYMQRFIQSTSNYKNETNRELAGKCRFDYRIARLGTPSSAADTLSIIHIEGNYALIKNDMIQN